MAISFTTPSSSHDLQQMLDLQQLNLPHRSTAEKLSQQGFVTVQHSLPLLEKMNEAARHVIAKEADKVVGYALVMLPSFQHMVPVLQPMFRKLESLDYHSAPLSSLRYYVMGQICVAEEHRGKGIFQGLYQKHKELYSTQFDLCITEVATRNPRSIRAHQNTGFEIIHTFTDETDTWHIIAWNWQ